jgi:hypothetical protein
MFTINLGIFSNTLKRYLPNNVSLRPQMYHCHFSERVGMLMPERQDFWWKITEDADVKELALQITDILLNKVIPFIHNHISDEDMLDCCLRGVHIGIGDYKRLLYGAILAKKYNRPELPALVNEAVEFERKARRIPQVMFYLGRMDHN